VAIVLSGTGSDGAVGLTRIKEQGGVTIVQLPADAEHDGMPQAAIGTGIVDFVLPVVDMPQKLIELWENARIIELPPSGDGEEPIAHRPRPTASTGRGSAAARRLPAAQPHRPRLQAVQARHRAAPHRAAHAGARRAHAAGLPATCSRAIRANASCPARRHADRRDQLLPRPRSLRSRRTRVIPELFKDKTPTDEVRVWVAACSTGEEAYSLAMLLADQAPRWRTPPPFQVFASDIDNDAIAQARAPAPTRPRSSPTSRRPACAATSPRTTTATASASRFATASCSPRTTCCAIRRSRGSTWFPAATC
jgi:two-component system CheB/CheR fusion protein